jgi:hypothetical protein
MTKRSKIRSLLLVLLLMLCYSVTAFSATYYVDYASGSDSNNGTSTATPWKYAPGMSGWTGSATLSNGDTVILKGGVTWTFASTTKTLWVLPVAGLTIQGGQRLGTPWGTGYPILDGTGSTVERSGIYMSGKTNITIDGIQIYNTYYATLAGAGTGINFSGLSSGLVIKNSYLYFTGNQSILGGPTDGTETIKIHDNIFTSVNRMFIAVSDGNKVNDIQIYNNTFNGITGFTGTAHGDGIMIGSACTADNTCLTNLKIHHNTFKGDWTHGATALIFLNNGTGPGGTQYGGNHVEIYDNQLAIDTDGRISPALIYIWSKWNDVKIYNNTFGAPINGSNLISSCINISHATTNVEIKKNIFSGCTNAITGKSTQIRAVDYNFYSSSIKRYINGWKGNQDCRDLATCYKVFGQEQHGKAGDPKFVKPPNGTTGHGNWTLQPGSPATGIGQR